jgi:hypothetical protein
MLVRVYLVVILVTCSSIPAFAQPGQAVLVAPSAEVVGSTIAVTWQSVPNATWYQFWLSTQDTSLVMEHWYTAQAVGCAAGGVCSTTLTPRIIAGAYVWYIRTWNDGGYGPWSLGRVFTMRDVAQAWSIKFANQRRFVYVLDGEAILDYETGLVWQRAPLATTYIFEHTTIQCAAKIIGGRAGWRMPTLSELRSLVDVTQQNPALPSGHPFVVPAGAAYFWTTTPHPMTTNFYGVRFSEGAFGVATPDTLRPIWCVRGGSSAAQ